MRKVKQTKSVKLLVAAIRAAPNQQLQISYKDLADRLFITTRSVQKLVNRLEAAHLIYIERSTEQWIPNVYFINDTYFQLLEEEKLNGKQ